MNQLTIRRIDDMHLHLRVGELLKTVLPCTTRYASRALVMPNTRPRAILTGKDVTWYRDQILSVQENSRDKHAFTPLMTIELRDSTTPRMIKEAHRAGAVAAKVYPLGVTTNSDEGVRDFCSEQFTNCLAALQECGMLLLIHGEIDAERTLVLKREEAFLPTLIHLAHAFPHLRIVLEHVSSRAGVEAVKRLGTNVAATITAHHLCLTLNDVIGYGIQPHHGCMPMPKDFDDRDALIEAATSNHLKFFLGSDSAPHPRERKEAAVGACGVFTAPILPQLLAEVFDSVGCLDVLEDFTSVFGAAFYGLPRNEGTITLIKKDWIVPDMIGIVVPFKAGKKLRWQLSSEEE